MQLDRDALRVEAKSGLGLLVGADAVIGDEGAERGCDGTALPVWTVVPPLPCLPFLVQTIQNKRLYRHRPWGKRR